MTYNYAVYRNGLLWKRTLGYPMARKVAAKLVGNVEIRNQVYIVTLVPTTQENKGA